jgi:DNA adenine methylase
VDCFGGIGGLPGADEVAYRADNPVNEADQHARHLWLCSREHFREAMKTEPDFYDAKIAGWWVWGQCIWIGAGLVREAATSPRGRGHGGVEDTCLIDLTSGTRSGQLHGYLRELAARLRNVRVCCGSCDQICGPSVTFKHGITGVFLDPPYADEAERTRARCPRVGDSQRGQPASADRAVRL